MLDALLGNRDERRRRQAVDRLVRREQQMRPGYKVWGYKNIFAKGFVVTDGPSDYTPREMWDHTTIGRWHVRLDPVLDRQAASAPTAEVLVLGQAFDDGGPGTRARVAERILRAITRAVGADAQTNAMDEVVTWLSGRYVVLVAREDRLDVYCDPLATRSVYWHASSAGVALASHSAILSDLVGGLDSARMRSILRNPGYVDTAGRWLPGLITPHDEVGQVYANARLTIRGTDLKHERFFPRADRVELPALEAATTFRDDLRQQVRNWISVAPVTVLTLTAGRDSKAILQAGLVDLQRADALTMTYHSFRGTGKSTFMDMMAASRLAAASGLPHMPIDVSPMPPKSDMARLYSTTFPTWQRYAALANTLYLGSPAKAATIFGVGGAVITGKYSDTSATVPTPELLATKFAQSSFGADPMLHEEFARWMDFTQFSVEAVRGHDFHDFFHWEHGLTKWGGAGYSEYDLATTPAPVLSSRRLLMAALSLPKQARVDALVYKFIAEGESVLEEAALEQAEPQ